MQNFIRSTCKLPFILHVSFQNAALCWSFVSSSHLQFEVWLKNWVTHTVGRWAWLFFHPQADCVKTWATAPSQKVSSRCPRWWLWWVILGKMRHTLICEHVASQTKSNSEWMNTGYRMTAWSTQVTGYQQYRYCANWAACKVKDITYMLKSFLVFACIHTYIHTN